MQIKELQQMLLEEYTVKNLNNISLTLINLYKAGNYATLQKIDTQIDMQAPEVNKKAPENQWL